MATFSFKLDLSHRQILNEQTLGMFSQILLHDQNKFISGFIVSLTQSFNLPSGSLNNFYNRKKFISGFFF